jgi:hypothetical protein
MSALHQFSLALPGEALELYVAPLYLLVLMQDLLFFGVSFAAIRHQQSHHQHHLRAGECHSRLP